MPNREPGEPLVPGPGQARPAAEQDHAASHHYQQAAEHLQRATDLAKRAHQRSHRGEHVSASELAKGAAGHIGEAHSHLAEAQRVHAAREAEAEADGQGKGSPLHLAEEREPERPHRLGER